MLIQHTVHSTNIVSYKNTIYINLQLQLLTSICLTDIDECDSTSTNTCHNGICMDTPGSYHCICDRGYQLMNNNTMCIGKKKQHKPTFRCSLPLS